MHCSLRIGAAAGTGGSLDGTSGPKLVKRFIGRVLAIAMPFIGPSARPLPPALPLVRRRFAIRTGYPVKEGAV